MLGRLSKRQRLEILKLGGYKKMTNLDKKVELFIAWVEGRYIPTTEEEEVELYAYGERVYPYLMELNHNK